MVLATLAPPARLDINTALLAYWLITAFGGWIIGNAKNRPVLGFFLGACFNLVGLIVIALVPKKRARYARYYR